MIKRVIVGLLTTNCYIYYNENNNCVIIDPGWDEHKIMARVQKLKLNPLGVILTHGHFDHTGGVGRLKLLFQKKGKTIKIAIHEADKKYIGENSIKMNQTFLRSYGIHYDSSKSATILPTADFFIREGENPFGMDLLVIETPGHTPGGICLYSEKEKILFSGDTLFNGGIGRTDFPGGSEKKLVESIKEKLLVLPESIKVYPGHGPETMLDSEKENNPFLNDTLRSNYYD